MDINYDVITFFQNIFILRSKSPRVANFADIIRIATMFIKKTQKKVS